MTRKRFLKAKCGQARILETVIAATIIFMVFLAATMMVNNPKVNGTQEKTNLDTLGYNVLSRLTESGTLEATIENTQAPLNVQLTQLKAFVQNSLPSSMFFNLTITNRTNPNQPTTASVANANPASFTNATQVSSTPLVYTSKSGSIYYLVLNLANVGEGTS
jgi:hypothetical protein